MKICIEDGCERELSKESGRYCNRCGSCARKHANRPKLGSRQSNLRGYFW